MFTNDRAHPASVEAESPLRPTMDRAANAMLALHKRIDSLEDALHGAKPRPVDDSDGAKHTEAPHVGLKVVANQLLGSASYAVERLEALLNAI